MTLDTKGDRTLFFDLLPVHFQTRSGFKIKLKLFTVPGQVVHETTRRVVLAGTDAVCFIADSQRAQRSANNASFRGMLKNLEANGIDAKRLPTVIQFNKRDLPDTLTAHELEAYAKRGSEPIFEAVALRGEGVVETLRGCVEILWTRLVEEHDFSRKLGVSRREFLEGLFAPVRSPGEEEVRP